MNEVVPDITREYIHRLAKNGKRVDNRGLEEVRPLKIEKSLIEMAEGSARVRLGDTDVLVGVKIDIGEPFPDRPTDGVLMTSAELKPMASPDFESGPPDKESIEIARVVDRGIRESRMIDLEKLCITPGEKVWMVFVDIQVIDYNGNLFDASLIASVAALTTTRVQAARFDMDKDFPLPIDHQPVSCTTVKIGDVLMVDPSLNEEMVADARLTITVDEKGDIRAIQKGLKGAFTIDEIRKCVSISQSLSKEVRKKIIG